MVLPTSTLLLLPLVTVGVLTSSWSTPQQQQHQRIIQGDDGRSDGISIRLFASLERMSRLVDITYCVGTTGLTHPFDCVSRCKDFPTLSLVTTWNTGVLMTDSCGYIAVDHGATPPPGSHVTGRIERAAPQEKLELEPEREPELQAEARTHPGAIVVAFRGTYSITNTVVDLSTIPQEYVPYPSPDDGGDKPPKDPEHRCTNCTVHMGFLTSWKTARRDVLPKLKSLRKQYPGYPIHLVGHSLGGAVAALAALEMKVSLDWDNIMVTTFGEPKVGNEGFVSFLDDVFDLKNNNTVDEARDYRRVTHANDPVPLLPLSEWSYRSHAGEIFISKPDLSPSPEDVWTCTGDYDPNCIAGSEGEPSSEVLRLLVARDEGKVSWFRALWGIPSRLKLWQLFFAHRDYFWRLGLCVPGGDPADWGRERYPDIPSGDEL